MKLEIEKFISEIEFPEAAMSLIEEGILCYKQELIGERISCHTYFS
ncbi:hypothetical protein [Bacillus thuringiensis]|nr:hypothetical protein [Bacillus thuringiensis]MED2918684.1 hypothetical protein [Bacillus thuringiensis]MED2922835.1 hypothetical protein [Bacillus thuringiensis]MED3051193.1 hypothetical protein [Bacillus thuringiensis]MED3056167.1 hypothetical protein [Bacillus thuringiensis]